MFQGFNEAMEEQIAEERERGERLERAVIDKILDERRQDGRMDGQN